MIPITTFKNKKLVLFGLGRSGITSALALQAGGAEIYSWDDNEATREKAKELGVNIANIYDLNFEEFDALVMTPGVAIYGEKTHAAAKIAIEAEIPIIGDIEIFAREINALPKDYNVKIIGITGTNGKSTTTALISHILTYAGKNVEMGGNIGKGVLSLEAPKKETHYVIELSSYQLDLTKSLRCNVAIQLNISEDHLERHGTMQRYVAAKRTIFANQTSEDTAVIGVDDNYGGAICTKLIASGSRKVIPISSGQFVTYGIWADINGIYDNQTDRARKAVDLTLAKALPGAHNAQNAAAAFAACKALGIDNKIIEEAIHCFGGLKHRLQKIGEIENVRFYNDSKATNADATWQALSAFEGIRWIVGGMEKSDGIDPLEPLFSHVRKAYLIGHSSPRFAKNLDGKVPFEICGDMETAMKAAYKDARQTKYNEIIILSPACASFDQYQDFEKRGDHFINIFETIKGQE